MAPSGGIKRLTHGRHRNRGHGGKKNAAIPSQQRRTPSLSALATNSHIQVVAREPDSDTHGTESDDDVPMFRNASYQVLVQNATQKSSTVSTHGNASFADMARSGIMPEATAADHSTPSPDASISSPSIQSGPGILRLRPSSRGPKTSRVWKPLDLDYSTTFKPMHTDRSDTPDSTNRLTSSKNTVAASSPSETVVHDYVNMPQPEEKSPRGTQYSDVQNSHAEYVEDILQSHGMLQKIEQPFDPVGKLHSHFASIRSIFGVELPGPEFVHHTPGIADGQLTFTLHTNGDVSAHLWSSKTQEWAQLGTFSYSCKIIDGALSTERLRGQKVGSPALEDTLEYFWYAAKQHERASVPPPEVLTLQNNPRQSNLLHLPPYSGPVAAQLRKEFLDRLAMPPPSMLPAQNSLLQPADTTSGASHKLTTQATAITQNPQSPSSRLPLASAPENRSGLSSLRDISSQILSYGGLELPRDTFGQPLVQYGLRDASLQLGQICGTQRATQSSENAIMNLDMSYRTPLFDVQDQTRQSPMTRSDYQHYAFSENASSLKPRLLVSWGASDSLASIRSSDGLEVTRCLQSDVLHATSAMEAMYAKDQTFVDTAAGTSYDNAALSLLGVQVGHREPGRTVLHDPLRVSRRKHSLVGTAERRTQGQHTQGFNTGSDYGGPSTATRVQQPPPGMLALSRNYLPPHWNNSWFEDADSIAETVDMERWWTGLNLSQNRDAFLQCLRSSPKTVSGDLVLLPVCENLLSYVENTPLNRYKALVPWSEAPRYAVDPSTRARSSFFTLEHPREGNPAGA